MVTCHPAEVTFLPLPQPKLVLNLATPEGYKAELTCMPSSVVCAVCVLLLWRIKILYSSVSGLCLMSVLLYHVFAKCYSSLVTAAAMLTLPVIHT